MTHTRPGHADELRARLVEDLRARRLLTRPRWQAAFEAVPREAFVDVFAVPSPDGLRWYDLDHEDPARRDEALAAVYEDNTLITQFDPGGTATSSLTTPSLMAMMLDELDARPGHRVLEIGTGTGYNAALLCHALGAANITTVDLHPGLVGSARRILHSLGYQPSLLCRDGREGLPGYGPYDRLIATCGLHRLPPAWLHQVRVGGLIMANLSTALVRFTLDSSGGAVGQVGQPAAFMHARDDITHAAITPSQMLAISSRAGRRGISLFPARYDDHTVTFLCGLLMPGVTRLTRRTEDGRDEHILVDAASGSWVRALAHRDGHADLVEAGPRDLWTAICQMVTRWSLLGWPPPQEYQLHVAPDGQHTLTHRSGWSQPLPAVTSGDNPADRDLDVL